MDVFWPFFALAILGAYHGLNPGMGWLFAVALGMQDNSCRAVARSLVPMALGHAISIALVVIAVGVAEIFIPVSILRILCASVLLGFGLYKFIRSRHPKWVGMRVSFKDLTLWSFLMATAHGAGLMLTPILLKFAAADPPHHHHAHVASALPSDHSTAWMLTAVGVHTLSFFIVTGLVAMLIYQKFGLSLLRKSWFNLDLIWAIALMIAGTVALVV
jgi:hypothetical protein